MKDVKLIDNRNKKSVKKNYLYNLIYQVVALITPLITTPYVSRVLKSDGIGKFSFTYSIASYFLLFGAFGFAYYAQREIAKYQGDQKAQSKIFWEIVIARFFTVGFSIVVYIALVLSGVYGEYFSLMWLLLPQVVGVAFDVSFFFQGNEEFGVLAFRNIVIKIIGVVAIILLVKKESDVWIYTLCQSCIFVISNLSLWISLPKRLTKVSFNELEIKKHFIPSLRLFVPTIAVQVYTMLDKTLIGLMIDGYTERVNEIGELVPIKISEIENGYYEQSEKIVKIVLTIITALGTVMIPRNSKVLSDGNYDEFLLNIKKTLRVVVMIAMPLMFGLISVSENFSSWFFGEGFEKVPYLIMIFSVLIILIGLSNVMALQYLIPLQEDNKYTFAVCMGAVTNLILNLLLIKPLFSYGAAIASIISELVVTSICFFIARKDVKLKELFVISWKYVLASLIMFAITYSTHFYLESSILNTIILTLEGIISYVLLLFVLRDKYFYEIIRSIVKKVFKHE